MQEPQLPPLTDAQLDTLKRFAMFEAGLEELQICLAGLFDVDFSNAGHTARTHFRVPEPGIVITREHIANALERRRFDLISERDLANWATVLLANDAYVLDPADEDLIAEWLNDISVNLGSH